MAQLEVAVYSMPQRPPIVPVIDFDDSDVEAEAIDPNQPIDWDNDDGENMEVTIAPKAVLQNLLYRFKRREYYQGREYKHVQSQMKVLVLKREKNNDLICRLNGSDLSWRCTGVGVRFSQRHSPLMCEVFEDVGLHNQIMYGYLDGDFDLPFLLVDVRPEHEKIPLPRSDKELLELRIKLKMLLPDEPSRLERVYSFVKKKTKVFALNFEVAYCDKPPHVICLYFKACFGGVGARLGREGREGSDGDTSLYRGNWHGCTYPLEPSFDAHVYEDDRGEIVAHGYLPYPLLGKDLISKKPVEVPFVLTNIENIEYAF